MNFAAFALFLICCHAWAIETNGYPMKQDESSEFRQFLDRLHEILKEGNDTLGIESLDPYIKDQSQIHIEDIIILDTLLTEINVNGLSNYIINNNCGFSLLPPKIIVDVTLSSVTANTNYENLNCEIGSYKIYGDNGNINLSAENIHLGMAIGFKLSEDWERMEVTEVKTELSLTGEFKFKGTGFYNDEEMSNIASYVISNMLPKIIEEKQDIVTDKLSNIFQNLFNDITDTWTFKEMLEMMGIDPFTYIGSVAI